MGEILVYILVAAGAVVGIALVIAAIAGIAIVTMLIYTVWLPSSYFSAMLAELISEAPEPSEVERSHLARIFRLGNRVDRRAALPNYFFGPAEVDIKNIAKSATGRCVNHFKSGADLISDSGGELGEIVLGVGVAIGLFVGSLLGAIITTALAVVHIGLMSCSVIVAVLTCRTLRSVDTMMRFARGIVIRCSNSECSRPIRPYPAYRCPRCSELHRDIRPGPHGIVSRICICGSHLPTLLLLGSGRLVATCQVCNTEQPAGIGKEAEIVIPFFGSVGAGKTQLIYTLTLALSALADDGYATVKLDERTRDRLKGISTLLESTGNTSPTVPVSPEPYIMHLKLGFNERLIYLFDAAGELHYRLPSLENLGYLDKGRTLVFVADPLAADGIWRRLPEQERTKLEAGRASAIDMKLSYEKTREQLRRMGRRVKRIQLAFVVTKADLLGPVDYADYSSDTDVRRMVMDPDGLDMANYVREAEQGFKSVKFFATAAITDEDGLPHESVAKLASWILGSEGIMIRERKLND